MSLLADPSIASKRWVWRQYDHMVRLGATVLPGSDAAVFQVRECDKILAASTDCNAIYCLQNPREGARIAIAECARNLACSGAVPLAVTDNLNFGNPHKPENFLQLREAVEGLTEGCHAFNVPVTGGNVSLYNESPAGSIDPTPTVGMVGLIADAAHVTTQAFKAPDDVIFLLGDLTEDTPVQGMGASHYLKVVHGKKIGPPPAMDYDKELTLHDTLRALIAQGLVRSAHDCSEGGLAVALAESCLSAQPAPLGAIISLNTQHSTLNTLTALFNETQSRVVITTTAENADTALAYAKSHGVPAQQLGTVTDADTLEITHNADTHVWPLSELHHAWADTIGELMAH
jgi:phosphoribosylformylglycinamidine synthase